MLSSIRLRKERSRNPLSLHRCAPHAAALTVALMLTPCLIDEARAADISTPRAAGGYVATDSSEICTFWSGLGVETPFLLTDDNGNPVTWDTWIKTVSDSTYDRFFDGLDGLIFLASPTGKNWLNSPVGQAWAHSPKGREWIDEFIKGAPPDRTVDYVRVCDIYGSGYYYIPGTDTCLRIGGYIREPDANPVTDYASLLSALNLTLASRYPSQGRENLLMDLVRSLGPRIKLPLSTPQQDTDQQGSSPIGKVEVETKKDDSGWSGTIRVQRDFGGGSGTTTPTTQTPQQNGAVTSQAGQQPDQMITVRIFVKGLMPEGGPVGPAIRDQLVSLVGGNVEPDLPASGTTRTAEQENVGSDKGAPQGRSDENGVAKFKVDFGDLKYLMRYNFFRDDLKFTGDYTLNGSVDVQKHGGFVGLAPHNVPMPNFSKGKLDGVMYRWNEFTIGTQRFWDVGYSANYSVKPTVDQVKRDITEALRYELGPDVIVTFDGNICRIELPAHVAGPYSPIPQKATAGIPEAMIKLRLTARDVGGAQ